MAVMSPEQFAGCVQKLIATGRERYLSDNAMLAKLEEMAAALREGMLQPLSHVAAEDQISATWPGYSEQRRLMLLRSGGIKAAVIEFRRLVHLDTSHRNHWHEHQRGQACLCDVRD